VELSDQRAKFLKESDADGLQVRLALAGSGLIARVGPADTLKMAVQADGFRIGRNAPFRAPKRMPMCVASSSTTRGGMEFRSTADQWLQHDDILGHMNNGAAAGQIATISSSCCSWAKASDGNTESTPNKARARFATRMPLEETEKTCDRVPG